jgi:hypothetical protein
MVIYERPLTWCLALYSLCMKSVKKCFWTVSVTNCRAESKHLESNSPDSEQIPVTIECFTSRGNSISIGLSGATYLLTKIKKKDLFFFFFCIFKLCDTAKFIKFTKHLCTVNIRIPNRRRYSDSILCRSRPFDIRTI